MGQMTFNFETDEKKPVKKQDKEIKEEKKIEDKKVDIPQTLEKVVKKEEKKIEGKKEDIPQTLEKVVKKEEKTKKNKSTKKTKAHQMAKEQRDIPVSEFFEQNRHILGFDNPTHSLITASSNSNPLSLTS